MYIHQSQHIYAYMHTSLLTYMHLNICSNSYMYYYLTYRAFYICSNSYMMHLTIMPICHTKIADLGRYFSAQVRLCHKGKSFLKAQKGDVSMILN